MNGRQLSVGLAALASVAVCFGAGVWWGDRAAHRGDQWGPERLISTAIDSVRANALDALPSDELLRRAVSGMLRELRDPYATLLRPDGAREYRGLLRGEGQGLGMVLRRSGKQLRVVHVFPNSPAALADVRAGDRVLSVNGVQASAPAGAAQRAPDAPEPDSSRLVLWRPPIGDTLRLVLARGSWHTPAVSEAALLDKTTGYVALGAVSAHASDELETAVERLVDRGAKSLVLDLRGNGGGLVEEGVHIASLFLPRGALVVSLSGKAGAPPVEHRVRRGGRWVDLPLAILVDARTASSAEIVAAALRDHQRALLVGEPTYGKGLVQRVVALTPELSMRMTTARWLTPRGRVLERRHGTGDEATGGLTPDVFVPDAGPRDAMAPPPGLTEMASARLLRLADTAAARALREGWATITLPLLESRLRATIDQYLAPAGNSTARAVLVGDATRLATIRVLEIEGQHDAVLRYGVTADHALRAALEVIAPGGRPPRVQPILVANPAPPRPVRVPAVVAPADSIR